MTTQAGQHMTLSIYTQAPTSTQPKPTPAMAIHSNMVSTILLLILICHSLDQAHCEFKNFSSLHRAFRKPNGSQQCEEQCDQKWSSCVDSCNIFQDMAKKQQCYNACDDEDRDCRLHCPSAIPSSSITNVAQPVPPS